MFPKLKGILKGTDFQSEEEVSVKMSKLLKRLTNDELLHCFEQWKVRKQCGINRREVYI